MTVEHTSGELVSWGPGVAEGVWSALVSLPKVSVLGSDVRLHGFTDDLIAKIFELRVIFATVSTELGPDELGAGLLDSDLT